MALTLVEAAKRETGDIKRQAIIELYARSHQLLAALPFVDITGNAYSYDQEETLPAVAFRGVNQAFTEDAGTINPLTERLTIAGGDLDVDRFIVTTQGMGQRGQRSAMKVKNLAHTIAHKFVKGDSDTDPKEFDGLQKRLTGNQLVAAGSASGGDALSLAKLDEAIDATEDPTHLLMNRGMRRRLTVASRVNSVGGDIEWMKDDFGRQIAMYAGLPIIEMDELNHVNATLAFNEANPGGGASVGTSIYCVSLREGMLQGLQNGGIQVRDLGELETKPVFRTRVEWYVGIALLNGRSGTRLWGIKDAAVVA